MTVHPFRRSYRLILPIALAALTLAGAPAWGQTTCTVPDNGTGTVDLPPMGCGYVSPQDLHEMIDGLPPGSEIRVSAQHNDFFNVTHGPGGSLGGEVENFSSFLLLNLQGTNALAGYQRTVGMQALCETHIAPRSPGDPVQSFDTQMFRLQGQLPAGDPDFDLLRITAGNGFGMPSPGHTTLTRLANGDFNVDSFFDITYRIDFVGNPGGPFAGMSGSTTGTIRMQGGTPAPNPLPCVVPDAGGTVNLPPQGCGYVSPQDLHQILDGLPPGTTVNIGAEHSRFFNVTSQPGGSLGGEIEQFNSELKLVMNGAGLERTVTLPALCETHIGPRSPGDPVQSFDTQMFRLQGQLPPGDPDFDLLRITAGNGFGLPSPGHTTLTRMPGTGAPTWNVDSFFDITYRIDFVGAPGGPLAGMSGSTTGTIRMSTGVPATSTDVPIDLLGRKIKLSNRPNPFGSGTTVEYRLANDAAVDLSIYDATGKRVRTLTKVRMPSGPHAMFWDGRNDAGRKLGSGVYFIKLSVDGKLAGTKRATLVR